MLLDIFFNHLLVPFAYLPLRNAFRLFAHFKNYIIRFYTVEPISHFFCISTFYQTWYADIWSNYMDGVVIKIPLLGGEFPFPSPFVCE